MALQNYGELKSSIADWLNRSDLTARIPDFVTLAEAEIFRQLRCPGNESHITYIADLGIGQNPPVYDTSKYISLTADFLEVKNITYGGRPLVRITDQEYLRKMANSPAPGTPTEFARLGARLHFYPPSDTPLDVDLWYYEVQGPLEEDEDTTNTLVFAPGLYLFGSLLQAQSFLIGDNRIGVWQAKYDQLFDSVMDHAWEAEFAGSTVSVSNVYGEDT